MRKVLAVLLLAGLLLLALAVPAMAGKPAGDDPSWYGQLHPTMNWAGGVPPGHREYVEGLPFPGNPGQVIQQVIHEIIQADMIPGITNYGQWTNMAKAMGPPAP